MCCSCGSFPGRLFLHRVLCGEVFSKQQPRQHQHCVGSFLVAACSLAGVLFPYFVSKILSIFCSIWFRCIGFFSCPVPGSSGLSWLRWLCILRSGGPGSSWWSGRRGSLTLGEWTRHFYSTVFIPDWRADAMSAATAYRDTFSTLDGACKLSFPTEMWRRLLLSPHLLCCLLFLQGKVLNFSWQGMLY